MGLGRERHGQCFKIEDMDFVLKVPIGWPLKSPHTDQSQSRGFERDQDWGNGSD